MPRISSSDNPRLKEAARLIASSRERRKSGRCVLEGEHLVDVYCRRYGPPESLLVAETAVESPSVRALLARVPPARTLIVAESAWAELAQLPAAVGLLAVVAAPVPGVERAADFCLLLDGVQDPGNVGSMLRSAAAAGVAQVFMSPHCAFAWSPNVLRAGPGAHYHVAKVASQGTSVHEADLTGPGAIAIGNEGAGLSDDVGAAARLRVTIPVPGG